MTPCGREIADLPKRGLRQPAVNVKITVPNHVDVDHGPDLLRLVFRECLNKVAAPVEAARGGPALQRFLALPPVTLCKARYAKHIFRKTGVYLPPPGKRHITPG
jgi:hypothetical protein